jgi:peptidase E
MRVEYIEKHKMALDELDMLIQEVDVFLKENGKIDEEWAKKRMEEIEQLKGVK